MSWDALLWLGLPLLVGVVASLVATALVKSFRRRT